MSNTSNAKTRVYVAGVTTGQEEADYAAILTWTEIADVMDVGEFGDAAETVAYEVLGDGRRRKKRGVVDGGTFDLTVARVADDAGQMLVKGASTSEQAFDFKVETVDGDKFFVTGIVMSAKNQFGGANEVLQTVFSIELTARPIEVPAA